MARELPSLVAAVEHLLAGRDLTTHDIAHDIALDTELEREEKKIVARKKSSPKTAGAQAEAARVEAQAAEAQVPMFATGLGLEPLNGAPPANGAQPGNGAAANGAHAAPAAPASPAIATSPAPSTAPALPFDHLTTNVKGPQRTVALGPNTAVVELNRKGKSSLLLAYRLAYAGKEPGFQHPSELAELAPAGATELLSLLTGPMGSPSYRLPIDQPSGEAHQPVYDRSLLTDAAPPVITGAQLGKILAGDALTREAVFARFAELPVLAPPTGLDDAHVSQWNEAVALAAKDGVTAPKDVLSYISAIFRSEKTLRGAEASEKAIAAARARAREAAAGAERIPELEAAYKNAVARESLSSVTQALANTEAQLKVISEQEAGLARVGQQIEAWTPGAQAYVNGLRAALLGLERELAAQREAAGPLQDGIRRAEDFAGVAGRMLALGTDCCGMCARPGADAREIQAAMTALAAERRAAAAGATQAIAGLEARAGEHRVAISTAERQIQTTVETYRQNVQAAAQQRAQLEPQLASYRATLDAAKAQLGGQAGGQGLNPDVSSAIQARIKEMQAGLATVDQLRAQENLLKEQRARADRAKNLEGICAQIQAELIAKTAERAVARVNLETPPGFKVALTVGDDGKTCEWRVLGTDSRAHPKTTISGAERGVLLIALALAWADRPPILMLDDLDLAGFDPLTIGAVLTKLAEAQAAGRIVQNVVAWSRKAEIPTGWTHVTP